MIISSNLLNSLTEHHIDTAVQVVTKMDKQDAADALAGLSPTLAASILQELNVDFALEVLEASGSERGAQLVELAEPDLVRFARLLENEDLERFRSWLPAETLERFDQALTYPDDTAGGMMETGALTLREYLLVEQAINAVRRSTHQLYYLYVLDKSSKLIGVLTLRDLLLSEPHAPIRPLIRGNVITLQADMPSEEVAEMMERNRFPVLPVVDSSDRFLGVVRHGQVIEAAREEAYDDLQNLVGAGDVSALAPVREVVHQRLPWLGINLITAVMAAAVIGIFEDFIAQATAIAVLLPIIAGQSGNTGAQSLAVVIRGLGMGEIKDGVYLRVLGKETLAGFINGISVALICVVAVLLWDGRLTLALAMGASMLLSMVIAAVSGTLIPILITKSGRDPAQSSSIFLTTITDIVGFGTLLGFAVLVLG